MDKRWWLDDKTDAFVYGLYSHKQREVDNLIRQYQHELFGLSFVQEPYMYVVTAPGTAEAVQGYFTTEADAIKRAEKLAAAKPGIKYRVFKAVTESVSQKPVITTRF